MQTTTTAANSDATTWRTVPEQAERIKASPRSLYRAIRSGELRAAVINGRGDMRICDEWLTEWLTSRVRAGARPAPADDRAATI